jgi:predicted amidophosphoribosyltransferase
MDNAICPKCKRATEYTDKDAQDENLVAECDHCGKKFKLHYADFLDVSELERDFESLFDRMKTEQQTTGKIGPISKRESDTWNMYWKHIGKVV